MNDNHALERLQQLFEEDPILEEDAVVGQETTSATDIAIDEALSAVPLSALSPEAQELILGLTESSTSLEPRARQLFVEAGDRAIKQRRDESSPLPRLLFLTRNRENQSVDAVADSLSADNSLLLEIERGETDIKELGAVVVASWITHLDVPTDIAIEALKATFLVTSVDRAAASAKTELDDEQNQFVDEVAKALSDR